ncbi:4Fe-4S dicluster domain-containing protein [Thermodesulfobacteriota bacterium]
MSDRTAVIREIAAKWLEEGIVEAVLGWEAGTYGDRTSPVIIRSVEESERLVFNERCTNNLATYLLREPVRSMGSVAIVAKGCDVKSLIGLVQESQVPREKMKILAVTCEGVKDDQGRVPVKCAACDVNTPVYFDEIAGEKVESSPDNEARMKRVAEIEAMSNEERYRFWREQFDKCIRCYACREACPLCICARCIADKNQPQWVDTSAHPRGNFSWNLVRAFHLAGRCVECEACETACPADIPLMLLNRVMAREVAEAFSYEAGRDPESDPPLRTFNLDDDNSFIL